MKVTYIYHSGFAVETASAVIIFDLFKDPANVVGSIGGGKRVYVVASHRHPDHFTPEIFALQETLRPAAFILSDDIRRTLKHTAVPPSTVYLHSGQRYGDGAAEFAAFPSTDVGISVCAFTDGLSIFHAGDLNLWQWAGESTEKEIKMAHGEFAACLRSIKAAGLTGFDAAMFPVDARQGDGYEEGARIFTREFRVANFFPMHFWGEPEKATNFDLYKNPGFGAYHALTTPEQHVTINYY